MLEAIVERKRAVISEVRAHPILSQCIIRQYSTSDVRRLGPLGLRAANHQQWCTVLKLNALLTDTVLA